MGTWGCGSFENDAASDWAAELTDQADLELVMDALTAAVQAGDDYLEVDECHFAIAAAEVVAALRNAPGADLPGEVADWVRQQNSAAERRAIDLALAAVQRVRTNSELQVLWAGSADADEWYAVLDNLEARLRQ